MKFRYGALVHAALAVCIACAPIAQADVPGLDPYVGQWGAHQERVFVNSDGTGYETYAGGTVNFRMSTVQAEDNTAYGNITSGGNAPVGSYVAMQLVDGGQGMLLSIAGGDNGFPFCKMVNGSYVNSADCGA